VRDADLSQFPCGEARSLVERAGFVHPDVQVDPAIEGGIDRGRGRAIFDAGEPTGVAVGEHVDGPTALGAACLLDDRPAEFPDPAAVLDFVVGDGVGFLPGQVDSGLRGGCRLDPLQHAVYGPGEVDGRRPGGF
jgi:hypothetical protein